MVQKFRETAENHMNVTFRDKNFMIAPIFRDSCYSAYNAMSDAPPTFSAHVVGGGVYFTERNGTERNAELFHGTDKCDHKTIILILEYLTRNGYI